MRMAPWEGEPFKMLPISTEDMDLVIEMEQRYSDPKAPRLIGFPVYYDRNNPSRVWPLPQGST